MDDSIHLPQRVRRSTVIVAVGVVGELVGSQRLVWVEDLSQDGSYFGVPVDQTNDSNQD